MVTAFAAGGLVDLVPALAMTLWGQRWTQHQRILRGEYHLKTAVGYSKPVPIRAAMRSVEGSSARYCCGNLSLRPMRVPAFVAAAGECTGMLLLEFFAANIRNPHTRRAYARRITRCLRNAHEACCRERCRDRNTQAHRPCPRRPGRDLVSMVRRMRAVSRRAHVQNLPILPFLGFLST